MPGSLSQLQPDCPPLNGYYVYLTGGCNLACQHCWLSPTFEPDGGTGGHLDYKLFELAIEEGLPLGLNNVKLTGGEPLLHPDFISMVDLLREKELGLTIETNGTLLTESVAHYLREKSTLRHISVSLDGAKPETHDAFRGVEGSFEEARRGMRYLVEVGYTPQVIMSIHAGNVNEMEALVRLAERMGAGSIKFNLVQPSGRGEQLTKRDQVLDIERLVELGEWVENELQKRTSLRLHYSQPMAFCSLKRLLAYDDYACGIFTILGILSTGHLAMCGIGMQVPELCYGLIGDVHLADVWRSNPILTDLRKQLPSELEGICSECIFRCRCIGKCVAENYHLTGLLTGSYWFCQMAAETGLFPPSRRTPKPLQRIAVAEEDTEL